MAKHLSGLFVFILLTAVFTGCSQKQSELVLAEFKNEQIKMPEFEKAYIKNVGSYEKAAQDSLQQLQNFLDLYVNFRLKLQESLDRGYGSNKELSDELLDYKKKVGVSYILEKSLVEPNIKTLYDLRKWELRVSHIMLRPDSSGYANAEKKARQILDSLKHGKTFEEMAKLYSDDNFSRYQGGDIYYITAGMIIPEFENAAYATKVGDVYAQPVKTKYGIHLIKVTERRERIPQIRASHILIDFMNEKNEPDTLAAKLRADSVYTMAITGNDFAELAKAYSEDNGSKQYGGDLNYFERRMMVKEFDEAAFNTRVGDIAPIVKTSYGFHIIKVTDKKPYPTFEEDKENLKRIYKQVRYNTDLDTLQTSLKAKYGFSLNQSVVDRLVKEGDTVKIGPDMWKQPWLADLKKAKLYSFGDVVTEVDTFLSVLESSPEFTGRNLGKEVVTQAIAKKSGDYALDKEALSLDKTNPEFADLMNEYRNGIYIFKIQDEEIWGKIVLDSARLVEHYNKTKENYKWGDRIEIQEIYAEKDSAIQAIYKMLKDGQSFDSLAAKYTERPGFKEKAGKFQMLDANASELHLKAWELQKDGDYTQPFKTSIGGYSIVKVIKKDPARLKTFEEAKPEVSSGFQEVESKRLENDFISRLKAKYSPVLYSKNLERAFKKDR